MRVHHIALVLMAVAAVRCGGSSGPSSTPTTPSTPTPVQPVATSVCFSFSPQRAELSNRSQRGSVQVVAPSSCTWTPTGSPESWITIVRSGALSQTGNGTLTFDVQSNLDENFGGCTTPTRTGSITVTDGANNCTANLTVSQAGSQTPFQPAASCSVAMLPYGSTVSGSLTSSDCTGSGSARSKYYTFQGVANQQITIQLTAGRFVSGGLAVPAMRLYGPGSGQVVSAGANVVVDNPTINRNLFCDGTYTLEVTSSINSTFNPTGLGNYTLRLSSIN